MEIQDQKSKFYDHYNHTDSCCRERWTSRECYEFMYGRHWQPVHDFYSNVVNGRLSLLSLFGSEKYFVQDDVKFLEPSDEGEFAVITIRKQTGKWERATFKIDLSYHGRSFDGWQKQPGLNTVQGLVEQSLGEFVDDMKVKQLREKCLPVEGCSSVAGRTDKGVTALQQVCSFYTWRKDVKAHEIQDAINSAAPGKLRVIFVSKVSRVFHPNFSAKWRRYFYIFPFICGEDVQQNCNSEEYVGEIIANNCEHGFKFPEDRGEENLHNSIVDELQTRRKPTEFSISKVDLLLRHLEGKLLSYTIFARDTKASRNVGPPTECFIYHARAVEARLPTPDHPQGTKVMCVEMVANRFLRKMVRVLVSTSVREAAAGAKDDSLVKLMDATSRRATAPPAPPDGLCLAGVGYTDFNPHKHCLIN